MLYNCEVLLSYAHELYVGSVRGVFVSYLDGYNAYNLSKVM